MKGSTQLRYYVITQIINGLKNYYSHWERLENKSSVYGIVWQEYLAYAYIYTNHSKVRKMVARIKEYDKKINILIEPVTFEEIDTALRSLNDLKLPGSYYTIDDKGRIIECFDRVTGQLIGGLKKV